MVDGVRIITGSIMVFLGAVLISIPFFVSEKSLFFIWIYGIPILILGIFALLNKKEDEIERIKRR